MPSFLRTCRIHFNRSPGFLLHQLRPTTGSCRPAAVFTGSTAYIGWNVFEDYAKKGSLCLKELVINAIEMLIGETKTIRTENLPDRGIVTLMKKNEEKRYINHILFAHTCQRGKGIEVIEDTVPLHNVRVSVRLGQRPVSVKLVPPNEKIPYAYKNGIVRIPFRV